jgi:phosphoribosylamine--glycine ligase
MLACAENRLATVAPVQMRAEAALTVVMAAEGYPGAPSLGGTIDLGDAESGGAKVFQAGTVIREGRLSARAGRVLGVTATAPSVREAADRAYAAIDAIDAPGLFCRRDIGWRELARERGDASPG